MRGSSSSVTAEIDAISDISFRENLYGYNLQGADMSRIAKPLTFPLDDEWISEFRDSCTVFWRDPFWENTDCITSDATVTE
ncbi:unnamed protein product, partial [Mesorhabditis spiculigera]